MPTPIDTTGYALDNSYRGTGVPACGPSKTDEGLLPSPDRGTSESGRGAGGEGILRLLQLADSALPIGSTAHSFGLEALVDDDTVTVDGLFAFLRDYLAEAGTQEAWFCRKAFALAADFHAGAWLALNHGLSALKPARESRAASVTLGRRFLQLVAGVSDAPTIVRAIETSRTVGSEIHHCTAFGLAAGCLDFDEDASTQAFLQQTVYTLISAAQRLLPFGQNAATRMLWDLHASIESAAAQSRAEEVFCSTPLIDIASMRHPRQITRLFIS